MNSRIIKNCQICNSTKLKDILNLGYIAPVNNVIDYKSNNILQKNKVCQCMDGSNICKRNNSNQYLSKIHAGTGSEFDEIEGARELSWFVREYRIYK